MVVTDNLVIVPYSESEHGVEFSFARVSALKKGRDYNRLKQCSLKSQLL